MSRSLLVVHLWNWKYQNLFEINLIPTKKLTLFEYIIDSIRKNDNYSVSDLGQNHYSFRSVINYYTRTVFWQVNKEIKKCKVLPTLYNIHSQKYHSCFTRLHKYSFSSDIIHKPVDTITTFINIIVSFTKLNKKNTPFPTACCWYSTVAQFFYKFKIKCGR